MTNRIPKPGQPVRGSRSGRAGMALFELLGRRWALRVIWELREGRRLNFRDLLAACEIAPSVLNTRLTELRETKLIELGDAGYALTKQGAALLHLLMPLHDWADGWAASLRN
jgi:DNA-binding HxlR family transcriptional regulator